jgi:hypothetical protein
MNRLLVALSLAASLPLTAATVSGTVKDLATGTPLASMTVEAYTAAGTVGGRANTNTSGSYSLTLPAGSYRVLAYDLQGVWATSFHADAESFDVSTVVTLASSQSIAIHFALRRAGSLAGVVRDLSGNALPGMKVTIYNPSGTARGWTTTDALGGYRLVVPPGSYRLAAWDDATHYLPRFNAGTLTFEAAPLLGVATSEEVRADFTLPPASTISGLVSAAATGTPLPEMIAEAWDRFGRRGGRAVTDATGAYRLALESGVYQIVFYDPAAVYAPSYVSQATSLASSPIFALALGESRTGIDGLLEPAARVSGQVRDARNGASLAGITAVAWNLDGTERTRAVSGETGAYALTVPPGTYVIGTQDDALVYLPRFRPDSASFAGGLPLTLFAGDALPVDFSLVQGGRFAGMARSAATGASLAGILIAAYDTSGALVAITSSRADGTYVLLVPAGSYDITAWHRDSAYAAIVRETAAVEGATRMEDFALLPMRTRTRAVRP